MGYWTRYCAIGISEVGDYTLKEISDELEEEICLVLSKEIFYNGEEDFNPNGSYAFTTFDVVCEQASIEGVDYFVFMRALVKVSAMYPTIYFDYEGRGEDWDDWFVCRVHDGKYGYKMAELPYIDSVIIDQGIETL